MKFVTVVRSSLRHHAEMAAEALSQERIPVRQRIEGSQATSGWGALAPFALEPLGHVFVVRVPENAVDNARAVLRTLSVSDKLGIEPPAETEKDTMAETPLRRFFLTLLRTLLQPRRQDAILGAAFFYVLERIRCVLDRDYEGHAAATAAGEPRPVDRNSAANDI